jgi:hypothetical protein
MTWVIGRAGPFGHSIGLSDIRVTLTDGTEHDCLQKVYLVGSQLVLGFAGSVAIGMEIVSQLSNALYIPDKDGIWDPLYVANMLPTDTKKLINRFPKLEKDLGCELILLSVHPTWNDGAAPWAKCYVHRFFSPEFEPIEASNAEIVSIGSGSSVKTYIDVLAELTEDMEVFKLELGIPGGSGLGLMSSITSILNKTPSPGISQYLQIVLVGRNRVRIGMNSGYVNGEQSEKPEMPRIATSLEELQDILDQKGISSISGVKC